MAKLTLNDIGSGHGEKTLLNDNFDAIETALENTLSRDGTSPNTMSANLDMNGYSILNQLASSGGENFVSQGDWATSTSYTQNNLVYVTVATDATYGGASYICTAAGDAHTSGTFSTDYVTNGYWQLLAKRGTSGGGSGDLVATNNLSDVDNAATALDNLGVDGSSGAIATGDLADNAVTLAKQAHLNGGSLIGMDGSGVPTEITAGTSGYNLQTNGAGSIATWALNKVDSLLTTRGDIITEGASGSQRLALGAVNTVLTSDGTDVTWATAAASTPADGTITQAKLSTATVSAAGTISTNATTSFTMNAYPFFPMVHVSGSGASKVHMSGHGTDGASADNPRFTLHNTDGKNTYTYDVDYRYVAA